MISGTPKLARLICVLLGILPLSACYEITGSKIRDIKMTSVQVVDLKDQPNLEWRSTEPRPSSLNLQAKFSTGQDLRKFADTYDFTVWSEVSACSGSNIEKSKELQNDPYVYDADGVVEDDYSDTKDQGTKPASRYEYFVFWNLKSVELAGQPDIYRYDFADKSSDVCIFLGGGNMLGSAYTTNTFVVPKSAIEAAVARWNKQHDK